MKKPLTARGRGGSGEQLDNIETRNLVCFPATCKPYTPENATAFIREISFQHHVDHLHPLEGWQR